ncbi:MAG: efflux RND transporter permease subunit [Verrucomicrobiales bacterium]|jgi:HAE1 family hydrophobic/amphiphilic exporter-1|nr:efflux RND transporter permease subunit [Verrucomicrobiales bacterium]
MILSDLSIRRPVFAWMLMFGFIVFGAISLGRLGVSEVPDVDFPVLTVNLDWTGAAPDVMESELVDPIEGAVIATQGLRNISSSIQMGQATITLEFDISRDIDSALTEVQSKLTSVRLPIGATTPTINKINPNEQPIMLLTVSGKRDLHALTQYVETVLADEFQTLPGVGQVVYGGYNPRNLRVWVDNDKLRQYDLTILDVQTALAQENIETASGYLENAHTQINVRTMGEGLTPEEVGKVQIKQRGSESIYNSTIRIKDVAYVEDGLDDIQRLGVMQGDSGLAIGIKKQTGANAVTVAKEIKQKLKDLEPVIPKDIKVEVNFDSTQFIKDAIDDTLFTLLLSALITGLVCYLFLGSWSSTFNVLLSIPTSVMGTFIVVYFMGFTLNFFTLLGLSLAIGIVVDDAIMVLENIVRHAEGGKGKIRAAMDGAREITFAAVAATAAVVAIFLPVIFMEGIIGKYFYQFGITISAAVLLSLLDAITLTPMRCSQTLTTRHSAGRFVHWTNSVFDNLAARYKRGLEWSLAHRWKVILLSLLMFSLSLVVGFMLRKEFLPPQDESAFLIRAQTPVGSSLHFTSDKLIEAEKILQSHPEVDRFFAAIGGFTLDQGEPDGDVSDDMVNMATIYVTLKPGSQRKLGQYELMDILRKELNAIPDFNAVPQDLGARNFSSGRGFPIELNIRGDNYGKLDDTAQRIIKRLGDSGLMQDFDTDLRRGVDEVHIIPLRDNAAISGVSMQTLGNTVSYAIGGVVQGQFTNGDRRYNVNMRLNGEQRVQSDDISKLMVRTPANELIPITQVAKLETVKAYQTLTRKMRERAITIYANVKPGVSQSKALDLAQKVAKEELPKNYHLYLSGGAASFQEAFASLSFALWLGIIIAYMVLASQFNSYVHPFTVLLALPFSVTGAFLALMISGQSLNLYSMIGLILLMGIVKKNSILLVEFANRQRDEHNADPLTAMLVAGPIRLRPILMTSLATLAAAIPPALAIGPGAESRVPLAVSVLGGVLISTAFTLFVVPCAYTLMSKLESRHKIEPEPLTTDQPLSAGDGDHVA